MLRCPLQYRCKCNVEARVLDLPKFWIVQRSSEHRKTSHLEDKSKYLKIAQHDVIHDAVRLQPLTTGAIVRRNLKHLSPQQQVSPQMKQSVQRLVHQIKVSVMAEVSLEELDGVKMEG